MIWFALALVAQDPDSGPVAYTADLYEPPVVRPFEPGDDFSVPPSEGDYEVPTRRPLTGPVNIDAYLGDYEHSPSSLEAAYQQGVTVAEMRRDEMAGPLDGKWRVIGADDQVLYDLLLSDSALGVEGAWREAPTGDGQLDLGVATALRTDDTLNVGLQGRPRHWLDLTLGADGRWAGVLHQGEQVVPVTMVPGF